MTVSSAGVFLQYLQTDPQFYIAVVITVVLSICIHELAHGVTAIALGDRTPLESGHMTLNPVVHMGLFSLILLFLAGFSWGLMPVDERRLRGRYAPALVALAGPLSNVLLAASALVGLGLWQRFDDRATADLPHQIRNIQYLLWVFGTVNVMLAMFNLVPVPPLDGSRILSNFSRSYATTVELLTATGAYMFMFIMVFSGLSRVVQPAAIQIAKFTLKKIRGDF